MEKGLRVILIEVETSKELFEVILIEIERCLERLKEIRMLNNLMEKVVVMEVIAEVEQVVVRSSLLQ